MWKPGETVALRGVFKQRVWYLQSALVVQDSDAEIALAVLPGAECAAPEGYKNLRPGAPRQWDRWDDYLKDNWNMQTYRWRTHPILILLQPEKFYSTILFWNVESNEFLCHYINFQLPFQRKSAVVDTLDLDLDLIINPDYTYEWKDIDDYQKAIAHGGILPEWIQGIEDAKPEVFDMLNRRQYPFDGSWLDWLPNPAWSPPMLSTNWDKI